MIHYLPRNFTNSYTTVNCYILMLKVRIFYK